MSDIQWYINNKELTDYYVGSEIEEVEVYITLWNNRGGDTSTNALLYPKIICRYNTIEDSVLIEHTELEVLNKGNVAVSKTDNSIVAHIKHNLIGDVNDGEETSLNEEHFAKLKLTINLKDKKIKENDLKELYLEVE